MRYISDDGKVFNTEQECTKHENDLRKKQLEDRIRKEKLDKERQERFELIKKHRRELDEEIQSYQKDYGCMLPMSRIDWLQRELFKYI